MDLPGTEQHGKNAQIGFGFFPGGGLERLSLATSYAVTRLTVDVPAAMITIGNSGAPKAVPS
jgi:hypothetical protein